jgi:hypothetical protein
MGCLSQFGKLGLTSIGDSLQQAEDIYNKVVKVLDQESRSDNLDVPSFSDSAFPLIWDGNNDKGAPERG